MKNLQVSDSGVNCGADENLSAFMMQVDEVSVKAAGLEQKLSRVERFYSASKKYQVNMRRGIFSARDNDKERYIASLKKRQRDPLEREAAAAKRMQELMSQFREIICQLTQHKWATPFLQPVDVVGLGLTDYYQVIKKPMDFATIVSKMDAGDGSGYKNVREICADVRLIFKNAMQYNEARSDVHVMAKTMLAKFEEKWLLLIPKVDEEDKRRKEEEAEAQFEMAKELCDEIDGLETHLEELKNAVLQTCRKMTHEEKGFLSRALTQLTPDEMMKAMTIVSEDNPNFQATDEAVDLDLDAQNDSTLWRLKYFLGEVKQSRDEVVAVATYNGNVNGRTNNFKNRKVNNCIVPAQVPEKRVKREP